MINDTSKVRSQLYLVQVFHNLNIPSQLPQYIILSQPTLNVLMKNNSVNNKILTIHFYQNTVITRYTADSIKRTTYKRITSSTTIHRIRIARHLTSDFRQSSKLPRHIYTAQRRPPRPSVVWPSDTTKGNAWGITEFKLCWSIGGVDNRSIQWSKYLNLIFCTRFGF